MRVGGERCVVEASVGVLGKVHEVDETLTNLVHRGQYLEHRITCTSYGHICVQYLYTPDLCTLMKVQTLGTISESNKKTSILISGPRAHAV